MIDFTAGDTFRVPCRTIIKDLSGAIVNLEGWTASAIIEFDKTLCKPPQTIDAHISGTLTAGFRVILVKKDTADWPACIAQVHTTLAAPESLESDKQTAGALAVKIKRLPKIG